MATRARRPGSPCRFRNPMCGGTGHSMHGTGDRFRGRDNYTHPCESVLSRCRDGGQQQILESAGMVQEYVASEPVAVQVDVTDNVGDVG